MESMRAESRLCLMLTTDRTCVRMYPYVDVCVVLQLQSGPKMFVTMLTWEPALLHCRFCGVFRGVLVI